MATLYSAYLLYCKTAVHAGDGSSTGTIDNPIQRERTTDFPVIRDSTLRGGVRELFEQNKNSKSDNRFIPTFGYKENGDKNSALNVYPARVLFFPVRSFTGVFAYITCPFVLKRFNADMELFFNQKNYIKNIPELTGTEVIASDGLKIGDTDKIGLEEFLFEIKKNTAFIELPEQFDSVKNNLAIISDTAFKYMVKLFTEKVTRNKISIETGTAEEGALFNAEYLPVETILYTVFGFSNEFKKDNGKTATDLQTYFTKHFNSLFELGGDKSIGKGLLCPEPLTNSTSTSKDTSTSKEEE